MPVSAERGARLARVLAGCACAVLTSTAAAAEALGLKPARLSEHVWYVQGRPGPASAASQGFNSNAGFVVTTEGVVVFDALGTPALGRALLAAMDELLRLKPRAMVPGHGAASRDPAADLAFTRDYLRYLRAAMGKAAEEMRRFDEAYLQTDWGRYRDMPAFDAANRVNAYGTYLLMERESLQNR